MVQPVAGKTAAPPLGRAPDHRPDAGPRGGDFRGGRDRVRVQQYRGRRRERERVQRGMAAGGLLRNGAAVCGGVNGVDS